jgi:hypothetical protein
MAIDRKIDLLIGVLLAADAFKGFLENFAKIEKFENPSILIHTLQELSYEDCEMFSLKILTSGFKQVSQKFLKLQGKNFQKNFKGNSNSFELVHKKCQGALLQGDPSFDWVQSHQPKTVHVEFIPLALLKRASNSLHDQTRPLQILPQELLPLPTIHRTQHRPHPQTNRNVFFPLKTKK